MEAAIEITRQQKQQTMYQQLDDIFDAITWGDLARTYFDKSASWFYNKMKGKDGNGKPTDFNSEEKERLKNALFDLAARIRHSAEAIQ